MLIKITKFESRFCIVMVWFLEISFFKYKKWFNNICMIECTCARYSSCLSRHNKWLFFLKYRFTDTLIVTEQKTLNSQKRYSSQVNKNYWITISENMLGNTEAETWRGQLAKDVLRLVMRKCLPRLLWNERRKEVHRPTSHWWYLLPWRDRTHKEMPIIKSQDLAAALEIPRRTL